MADALFVSYAWKAEQQNRLVDRLEAACQKRNITLKRDTKQIGYGESIRAFMDEIGRGGHIALILSEPYFKSEYCMYELKAIHEQGAFHKRVFPIVLKGTPLHKPVDRVRYLKHWQAEKEALETELDGVGRTHMPKLHQALDNYAEFRRLMDGLLDILADMNSLTEEIHVDTDFAALLDRLMPPVSADKPPFLRHRTPDEEFRQRILKEIRQRLGENQPFANELEAAIKRKQGSSSGDPAAVLCASDLEEALDDLLRPAVETSHERVDSSQFERLWQDAKAVMGWLCLLAVDDDWVQQRESAAGDDLGLEMVVQTAFGVEVVSARYRQFRPQPVITKDATEVSGAGAIPFPAAADSLNEDHALDALLLAIWKRAFPESSIDALSEHNLKNLNATLEGREKRKDEHFYVPVPQQTPHPLCRKEFYEKLLRKLPAIRLLFFRSFGDRSALRVDDEYAFMAAVRDFLSISHKLAGKP